MKNNLLQLQISQPWHAVLGLDIGLNSVKYLLLRRWGKGMRVERFGRFTLDNEDESLDERIGHVIDSLLKRDRELRHAKIILGIDGLNVVVSREGLPALSKKELKATIAFGVEKEISGEEGTVPIVHDYLYLGPDTDQEGQFEYLTFGASEQVVDERVKQIVAQGVVPTKVVPTVIAMSNLFRQIPEIEDQQYICVLDVGVHRSMLIFFKHGHVDFYREISIGGNDFTNAITGTIFHEGQAIQLNASEARDFKYRYGYPLGFSEGMTYKGAPLSEIGALMRPVVERLTGEIQRSIAFYKEKSQGGDVEAVYLIGGGARLHHLSDVLSEKIEIPVALLPVPKDLRIGGGEKAIKAFHHRFLEQAVSLSLALESSSRGNLLPEAYKKIQQFTFVQRGLRISTVVIASLILAFTFKLREKRNGLQVKVDAAERRTALSKNTGPRFAALLSRKGSLEKQIGELSKHTDQDQDLIQVLRLVSHAMPSNLALIYLEYGRVEEEQQSDEEEEEGEQWILKLQGMSPRPTNDIGIYMGKFIVELERSGYFSEVQLVKDFYEPEAKQYGFEILCTLDREIEFSRG